MEASSQGGPRQSSLIPLTLSFRRTTYTIGQYLTQDSSTNMRYAGAILLNLSDGSADSRQKENGRTMDAGACEVREPLTSKPGQKGVTTVEYAVMLVLVAIAVLAFGSGIAGSVTDVFSRLVSSLA